MELIFLGLVKMSTTGEKYKRPDRKIIQTYLNLIQIVLNQDLIIEVSKNVRIFGGTSKQRKRIIGKVWKEKLEVKYTWGINMQVCWVNSNEWNNYDIAP